MIAWRSSGSLRRAGRGAAATAASSAGAGTGTLASSFEVDSGWLRLQPSR